MDHTTTIDFTPDSQRLVVPWNGATFYTLVSGTAIHDIGSAELQPASVKISPDGSRVAIFSTEGNLFVYNTTSGKEEFSVLPDAPFKYGPYWTGEFSTVNPSYVMDFSPDGKTLAFVTDKGIGLWHVEQRQLITNINTFTQSFSMKFSPLGDLLVSGDDRGYLQIWDPATGENVYSAHTYPNDKLGYVTALAFNSDATILVTGGYGENPKTDDYGGFVSLWQIR